MGILSIVAGLIYIFPILDVFGLSDPINIWSIILGGTVSFAGFQSYRYLAADGAGQNAADASGEHIADNHRDHFGQHHQHPELILNNSRIC
jgi:hypothetical protein